MNLRNSLFPLIVIVFLVYIAGETLLRDDPKRLPYSEVERLVLSDPESVEELSFRPTERKVVVTLTNGTEIRADYPRAASPRDVERLAVARGVAGDSKDAGSWWARGSILTSLLPFILLFGFGSLVVVLSRRWRRRISNEDFRAT